MKNKLEQLFRIKKENILSIYFTAGYPQLNDTSVNIKSLQETNVDLIEIGIPYSDPIADGPIIQAANAKAIENGMNLCLLFTQLDKIKDETSTPIILMGYLNVIIQFGIKNFYKECKAVGVSGVIIPDLPIEEYQNQHQEIATLYGINNIFLITPNTSLERIKLIDRISHPFIYVVSSNSITGNNNASFKELDNFYISLSQLNLNNKTLIGFGINSPEKFQNACAIANGAIIGSAFIQSLNNNQSVSDFIQSIYEPKITTT